MREEVDRLWDMSISPQTAQTYLTAIHHLLRFAALWGIIFVGQLPPLTEDTLIYFVSYCHHRLHLRFNTIKLYLAGIRFHYLRAGLANPFLNSDRLNCILRGIRKSQGTIPAQKRFPIKFDLLKSMCQVFNRGIFSPCVDLMLLCACTMAFFGFMRCGEFTVRSSSLSLQNVLCLKDIRFSEDLLSFYVLLKTSKTDPFRLGVNIPIFKHHVSVVCPVTAMVKYLQMRRNQGATSESPLFVANGSVLTRNQFIAYVRHVLAVIGVDSSNYCGHSFRIGAATTAAAAGIPDHLIQTLGRWSSNCYARYIRTSSDVIKAAQNKMI